MAEVLLPLANAKTPDFVGTVVSETWKYRHEGIPQAKKLQWAGALSISEGQLDQVGVESLAKSGAKPPSLSHLPSS